MSSNLAPYITPLINALQKPTIPLHEKCVIALVSSHIEKTDIWKRRTNRIPFIHSLLFVNMPWEELSQAKWDLSLEYIDIYYSVWYDRLT
jgi:hypothetical protein